jgi:hypothetical protein
MGKVSSRLVNLSPEGTFVVSPQFHLRVGLRDYRINRLVYLFEEIALVVSDQLSVLKTKN